MDKVQKGGQQARRAAQAWREIHQRFLEWSLNQELDL
jgi:hypothetical protein